MALIIIDENYNCPGSLAFEPTLKEQIWYKRKLKKKKRRNRMTQTKISLLYYRKPFPKSGENSEAN